MFDFDLKKSLIHSQLPDQARWNAGMAERNGNSNHGPALSANKVRISFAVIIIRILLQPAKGPTLSVANFPSNNSSWFPLPEQQSVAVRVSQ